MRDRSFIAVCALIMVNQLGFGIITPVLPSYARSFGLDASSIGLVIGIYGFARILANVPAGQLAERRGRREVLIAGTVITSVASALMATAGDLPQLLLYRLLAGFGAATVITGGQIMIGDIATPENRGRMMSAYQGFFFIGSGLGPAPGGLLADHFGLRAPFVAYAVFSALACVCALLVIRETRPAGIIAGEAREAPSTAPEPAASVRATLTSLPFLLIGFVAFVQSFARTGAIFTVLPLLGSERLLLSASQIGFGLTLINLLNFATLYHSGVFADRFGRKPVIAPAKIVSGVALAMFAWSPSYGAFLASAALWGIGSGLSGPAPAAYVADFSHPTVRARIFGYFRSAGDGGYVAGPLLLGALADHVGYGMPLMLTAAMTVVAGALFWVFAPEFHRRPASVATGGRV